MKIIGFNPLNWRIGCYTIRQKIGIFCRRIVGKLMYPFDYERQIDRDAKYYALEFLHKCSEDELSVYYCQLNCWKWVFPEYQEYYKRLSGSFQRRRNKSTAISPLMNYIRYKVPEKRLSWEWNKERMTETEFNEYWSNRGQKFW